MNNQKQAEKDYLSGMKYKDIAEKYQVSINTVKSWKKNDTVGNAHKIKRVHTKRQKGCTQNRKRVHTKKRR